MGSNAILKKPSYPVGPIAVTIFCVSLNGTSSGVSKVSPWKIVIVDKMNESTERRLDLDSE